MPRYSGATGEDINVDGRKFPIYGDESYVVDALRISGTDTAAVTATETLGPEGIQDLVWKLEPLEADLVVATGVVDVAGPRLSGVRFSATPPSRRRCWIGFCIVRSC